MMAIRVRLISVLAVALLPLIPARAHDEAVEPMPRFSDLVVVEDEPAESPPAPGAESTDESDKTDTDDQQAHTKVVVPAKFANLRFDEDWSFLADPDKTTNHWFPGMKYVDMGGGWHATFSAQFRIRRQDEDNKNLMKTSPQKNDFYLTRIRAGVDLRHESGLRVFVEGLDARIHGNDRPAIPIDRNDATLQNGFVEYGAGGLMGRGGRMEMQYGAQRLISPLDWGNTRRTFQGGLARYETESQRTDLFVTRPVRVDPRDWDSQISDQSFGGIWHTIHTEGGSVVDLFGLRFQNDSGSAVGGNGVSGDQEVYTLGARYKGKTDNTDYELWAAQQTGDYAQDDIHAFAWTVAVGQTFPEVPGKPRVALEVDYASGDSDPDDGDYQTFNQLFPLAHAYFGYLDLVGRQNIIDVSPSVTAQLDERTTARAGYHFFKLAESEDALYNAGGAPTFDDPTGAAGRDVGQEIDLTLAYKPEFLAPHGHVLLGWSRFFAEDHVTDLGGRGNADLVYVQFTMTF